MFMPNKLPLDFSQFELVVIHLGNDLGVPLFREQIEFRRKIDGFLQVVLRVLSACRGPSRDESL